MDRDAPFPDQCVASPRAGRNFGDAPGDDGVDQADRILFAALVAILMVLVARRDGPTTRLACMSAALLLLPAVVILGTWQVRNVRVSGSAEFSQIKNVNLLMYRAAAVVALRDGISLDAARDRLQRELKRQYPDLDGAGCWTRQASRHGGSSAPSRCWRREASPRGSPR